jgi:hypothetical protein
MVQKDWHSGLKYKNYRAFVHWEDRRKDGTSLGHRDQKEHKGNADTNRTHLTLRRRRRPFLPYFHIGTIKLCFRKEKIKLV